MKDTKCENSIRNIMMHKITQSFSLTFVAETKLGNVDVLFYTFDSKKLCGTRERITSGRKLSNKLCSKLEGLTH